MNTITRLDAKSALIENMKSLRSKANLTQGELATKIGKSQKAVSEIESGKTWPDYKTIQALATVFGVEETDLLVDPNMVAALKYHANRK